LNEVKDPAQPLPSASTNVGHLERSMARPWRHAKSKDLLLPLPLSLLLLLLLPLPLLLLLLLLLHCHPERSEGSASVFVLAFALALYKGHDFSWLVFGLPAHGTDYPCEMS
jgi:hypothetical protein